MATFVKSQSAPPASSSGGGVRFVKPGEYQAPPMNIESPFWSMPPYGDGTAASLAATRPGQPDEKVGYGEIPKQLGRTGNELAATMTGTIPEFAGAVGAAAYDAARAPQTFPGMTAEQFQQMQQARDAQVPTPNPLAGAGAASREAFGLNLPELQPDPQLAPSETPYFGDAPIRNKFLRLQNELGGMVAPGVSIGAGTAIAGPLGGGALAGTLFAAEKYQELKDAGVPDDKALRQSALFGGGSAALFAIPVVASAAKFLPPGLASRVAVVAASAAEMGGKGVALGGVDALSRMENIPQSEEEWRKGLEDVVAGVDNARSSFVSFAIMGGVGGLATPIGRAKAQAEAKAALDEFVDLGDATVRPRTEPSEQIGRSGNGVDVQRNAFGRDGGVRFQQGQRALPGPALPAPEPQGAITGPNGRPAIANPRATAPLADAPLFDPNRQVMPEAEVAALIDSLNQQLQSSGRRIAVEPIGGAQGPLGLPPGAARGPMPEPTPAIPLPPPMGVGRPIEEAPSRRAVPETAAAPEAPAIPQPTPEQLALEQQILNADLVDSRDIPKPAPEAPKTAKQKLAALRDARKQSLIDTTVAVESAEEVRARAQKLLEIGKEINATGTPEEKRAIQSEVIATTRELRQLEEAPTQPTSPSQGDVEPQTSVGATQTAPEFSDMVKEAQRWRGAAMNVARGLEGNPREALKHSSRTTKGDLDKYLMNKFGVGPTEARDVSNELTRLNLPDDLTAQPEDFAGEPWVKTAPETPKAVEAPTQEAEFVGLQERPRGQAPIALYNIPTPEGGKTTVSAETAAAQGYSVPEPPVEAPVEAPKDPESKFQEDIRAISAESKEKRLKDLRREFMQNKGLSHTQENGIQQILHMSSKKSGSFQLSSIGADGIPNMDQEFDNISEAIAEFDRTVGKRRADLPDVALMLKPGEANFIYEPRLRPVDIGTIPKEGFVGRREGGKWGRAAFDRPLTEKELDQYELTPIGYEDNTGGSGLIEGAMNEQTQPTQPLTATANRAAMPEQREGTNYEKTLGAIGDTLAGNKGVVAGRVSDKKTQELLLAKSADEFRATANRIGGVKIVSVFEEPSMKGDVRTTFTVETTEGDTTFWQQYAQYSKDVFTLVDSKRIENKGVVADVAPTAKEKLATKVEAVKGYDTAITNIDSAREIEPISMRDTSEKEQSAINKVFERILRLKGVKQVSEFVYRVPGKLINPARRKLLSTQAQRDRAYWSGKITTNEYELVPMAELTNQKNNSDYAIRVLKGRRESTPAPTPTTIRVAALDIAGAPETRVRLADLREKLGGTREQQDAALLDMQKSGELVLMRNDDPQDITPRDEAAKLMMGSDRRDMLYLKPEKAPTQAQEQAVAIHEMTANEYFQSEIDKNRYKAKYEQDEKARNLFANIKEQEWKEALEARGEIEPLPLRSIDDYVARFGESELFRRFRGKAAKGIEGWIPTDLRREGTDRDTFFGFTKDENPLRAGAIAKALNKEKDLPGGKQRVRNWIDKLYSRKELAPLAEVKNKMSDKDREILERHRATFLNSPNKELEAKAKKEKTVYLVNGVDVGKIAHDYAQFRLGSEPELLTQRTTPTPEPPKAPTSPVETTSAMESTGAIERRIKAEAQSQRAKEDIQHHIPMLEQQIDRANREGNSVAKRASIADAIMVGIHPDAKDALAKRLWEIDPEAAEQAQKNEFLPGKGPFSVMKPANIPAKVETNPYAPTDFDQRMAAQESMTPAERMADVMARFKEGEINQQQATAMRKAILKEKADAEKQAKKDAPKKGKKRGPNMTDPEAGAVNLSAMGDLVVAAAKGRPIIRNTKGLPEKVFDESIRARGLVNRYERRAQQVVADFEQGYRKSVGGVKGMMSKVPDNLLQLGTDYLTERSPAGKQAILSQFPVEMHAPLRQMRTLVDELTQKWIDWGVVSPGRTQILKNNKGSYLSRQYKTFNEPNFRNIIPEMVKQRMRNLLRKQDPSVPNTKAGDDIIEGRLNEWIDVSEDENNGLMWRGSPLGARNFDIMKQRNDFPQEVLDLWGVEKDVTKNLLNTVMKQAKPLANTIFQNKVLDHGRENNYIFTKADIEDIQSGKAPTAKAKAYGELQKNRQGTWMTEAAEQGKSASPYASMGVLADVYVPKPLKNAMQDMMKTQEHGLLMKTLLQYNGIAAMSKTVGSVTTQSLNFIANQGFFFGSGYAFYKPLTLANRINQAIAMTGTELKSTWGRSARELAGRGLELGVMNDADVSQEIAKLIEGGKGGVFSVPATKLAEWGDRYRANRTEKSRRAVGAAAQVPKWIQDVAGTLRDEAVSMYQAGDDFWKALMWLSDTEYQMDLHPSWSRAQAEEAAAVAVREYGLPFYSESPRFIQNLRYVPIPAPFKTYAVEAPRVLINQATQAKSEIFSGNATATAMGFRRSLGQAFAYGMPIAGSIASALAWKLSDQDEDIIRDMGPEWNRNSNFVHYNVDRSKGIVKYWNVSRTSVQSEIGDPINAFIRGDEATDKAARLALASLDPFLQEQLGWKALRQVIENEDDYGRPIYNDADTDLEFAKKVGSVLGKSILPGTVESVRRILKDDAPIQKSLAEATGQRITTVNMPKELEYATRSYMASVRAPSMDVKKAESGGNASDIAEQKRQRLDYHKQQWESLHDKVSGMKAFGVDTIRIMDALKKGGMSQKNINNLMYGIYVPPESMQ